MARVAVLAKRGIPAVVTVAALAVLFMRVDFTSMLNQVQARSLLLLAPALLLYGAVSLWIEARSLVGLLPPRSEHLGLWPCAKLKAATYPFALIHYALGAGSLTLLLRRHAGMSVSYAAGVVMLISLFDLGLLLTLTAFGAAVLGARAPALQAGLVVVASTGIVAGFAVLRTSRSTGPFERLRQLELFRPVREASPRLLVELGTLRLFFVIVFIALGGGALASFGIEVPIGDLIVNLAGVSLVAALPIAVSGLGTGQVAFVYLFRHWAEPEALLACSLTLSAGIIALRAALGVAFSRELMREAYIASREVPV